MHREHSIASIDFGSKKARAYFDEGWSIIDEKVAGRSAVWSSGYSFSSLKLPLSNTRDLNAQITVYPLSRPRRGPQRLSLHVNGERVGSESLQSGWQTIDFRIPAAALING